MTAAPQGIPPKSYGHLPGVAPRPTSPTPSAQPVAASPSQGTYGVDDYPDKDATNCSATFGIYSWCKAGSDLSPRRFGYRNCTDFVAWRLGITYASLAFPGGDGNARGWKQGAINSGYQVGTTPVIGAVAWWGTEVGSGYGHVAVVVGVNSDGSARVEQYNKAGTGLYSITPATTADAYLYIGVNPPSGSGGSTADGSFVTYAGNVYRIAGGAPVYVSNWNSVGGPQPTTPLTDTQFASLRQYPSDGTFVSTLAGPVYEFAGGAPLYVSSWDAIGGSHPTILVDGYALDHGDGNSPLNHIHQYPADGTQVAAWTTHSVWVFAGGAPINTSSCLINGLAFCDRSVTIDQYAVDHLDHMRPYPADGTQIASAQTSAVWVFAGGAPLVTSACSIGTTTFCDHAVHVDQTAVDHLDHMRPYPADGTQIASAQTSEVWVIAGGAPINTSSCSIGTTTFCDHAVHVDQTAVDHLDHMRPYPADGTQIASAQTSAVWVFAGGAPLVTSACTIGTTTFCDHAVHVDQTAVDHLDHMRPYPADGTQIASAQTSEVWVIAGGAPINTSSCSIGTTTFCDHAIHVDQNAVDHLDHLLSSPPDGTRLLLQPSGQVVVFHPGGCSPVDSSDDAVAIDETQSPCTATTSTSVSSGSASTVVGQKVTLSATVASTTISEATGTVVFSIDGTPSGPVKVAKGRATLAVTTLHAGVHQITATYSGDAAHRPSTSASTSQTVQLAATTTKITQNANNPKVMVATVTPVAPGAGVPTGSITFVIDGVTSTATMSGGKATIRPGAGSHTVTATYPGTTDYATSTGSL